MARNDQAKTLVPKLRFPEFRGRLGWNTTSVGAECTIYKGRGVSKADISIDGARSCIRYGELYTRYGEVINTVASRTDADESSLFLSRSNDVLIPASGETAEEIATAACVLLDGVALGGDLNVLRTKHDGVFLSYYINSALQPEVAKIAQGQTVAHLYPNQLRDLSLALPSPAEQRKIAACLTSLDELIAAEGRKLEALRNHKKGLMQQLFPREGETVPRLRFGEFRGAGEWEERRLGEFISERSEMASTDIPLFSLTIDDGVTAKTERYERSFLVTDESDAYKVVEPDDFAFNPMNLRFGAIGRHVGRQPVALSKYYNIFTCDASVDSRFCHIYFRSDVMVGLYDQIATGSLIEKRRVHFDRFLRLDIRFPELAEQQRIAACLNSLGALIAAVTDKLVALKAHKKGLMQQLFPIRE